MPDIAIVGFVAGYVLFFLLGLGLGRAATRGDQLQEQECKCGRERETEHA